MRRWLGVALALLAVSTAAARDARAAAAPAFALRAGWALAGTQQTLESGPALGASFEWPYGSGEAGVAIDWAHDSPGGAVGSVDLLLVGGFRRWRFTPAGPYFEGGAGLGQVHRDFRLNGLTRDNDDAGPAVWAGAGVPLPFAAPFEPRLDVRYYVVLAEGPGLMGGGGNAEDAYTVAASFAFGRRGSRDRRAHNGRAGLTTRATSCLLRGP